MTTAPDDARKAYQRAYYERNREKLKARAAKRRQDKPEECRAVVAAWHAKPENKKRVADYMRTYSKTAAPFKEAQKRSREKNKDRIAAKGAEWRKANPDKNTAKSNRYRCSVLQRTPAWLDQDDHWLIDEAYALAALRTRLFGFPWHVDHEIPLQGRAVSGLHVPTNLRVIPAVENVRKSNRFTA